MCTHTHTHTHTHTQLHYSTPPPPPPHYTDTKQPSLKYNNDNQRHLPAGKLTCLPKSGGWPDSLCTSPSTPPPPPTPTHTDTQTRTRQPVIPTCRKGETCLPKSRIMRRLARQSRQPIHQPITISTASSDSRLLQAGMMNMDSDTPSPDPSIIRWLGRLWKNNRRG